MNYNMEDEVLERNRNLNRGFRKLRAWKEAIELYVFVKEALSEIKGKRDKEKGVRNEEIGKRKEEKAQRKERVKSEGRSPMSEVGGLVYFWLFLIILKVSS